MGRVIHFEIPARDPEKAVKFYTDVFGWKIENWGEPPYWLATTGPDNEPGINGAIVPKADDGTAEETKEIIDSAHAINAVITIDVPDIDAAIAKIEELGGKIVMDVWPIADIGKMAYFSDLDGNIVGVMQSK